MSKQISISVWRDRFSNAMQLSIDAENEQGFGTGYRIAGPTFIGDSELLMKKTIKPRDAKEIRHYLDQVLTEATK